MQILSRKQKNVLNYINESKIVLLVSHDLKLISDICSRVIVLENGKVIKDTSPDEAIKFT